MPFQFGGIRESTNKREIKNKKSLMDCLVLERELGPREPWFLVLIDRVLDPVSDKDVLYFLDRECRSLKNYTILSVTYSNQHFKTLDDIQKNEGNWRSWFQKREYHSVLAFGMAFYAAQQSSDTKIKDYYSDEWNPTRAFLSEEFLKAGDLFYYPVDSTLNCWPIGELYGRGEKKKSITKDICYNYRTEFMKSQIARMISDKKDLSKTPERSIDMRPYEIVEVMTKDHANSVFDSLMSSELLAADLETGGFDRLVDEIGCITMTNNGVTSYYIPWELVNIRKLSRVLLSAKRVTFSNGKFDVLFMWREGVTKQWFPTDDSMLLSHAMNSDQPSGLKPNATRETYFGGYENELERVKRELGITNYLKLPKSVLIKYAGLDPIVTWRVQVKLDERCKANDIKHKNEKVEWARNRGEDINDWGVYDWYKEVMMPKYKDMMEIEFEGVYIDEDELNKSRRLFDERIKGCENELKEAWNVPPSMDIDFKSPQQLGLFIEEHLKWELTSAGRGKQPVKGKFINKYTGKITTEPNKNTEPLRAFSTSADALTEWKMKGHDGIDKLQEFRSLQMGKNTFVGWRLPPKKEEKKFVLGVRREESEEENNEYVMGGFDHVGEMGTSSGYEVHIRRHIDGTLRMHQNFAAFGAESMRHRSREPNLQQIPVWPPLGPLVKPVFTCPRTLTYSVRDENGRVWTGKGNDLLIIKRGDKHYRAAFSQLQPSDEIVRETSEQANPNIVIQIGSLGPYIRTHEGEVEC